jgi:hypothetical protein
MLPAVQACQHLADRYFASVRLRSSQFPVQCKIYRPGITFSLIHLLNFPCLRSMVKSAVQVRAFLPSTSNSGSVQSCSPTLVRAPTSSSSEGFERSQNRSERGTIGNCTVVAHSTPELHACTYILAKRETRVVGVFVITETNGTPTRGTVKHILF